MTFALMPIVLGAQPKAPDPVLNITYRCEGGECSTGVTREEFDALVLAIDPKMPEASKRSLAAEYSRLLIMAAEARRRGLDQSPEVQTLLKLSSLQVLSTSLVKAINANPSPVSSQDVETYFRDHEADYYKVSLSRIFVPAQIEHSHSGVSATDQVAALHARAVKEGDFEALQREVAGAGAGQNVRLGPTPCLSLPEKHRQVCLLKPSEISPVIADNSGYSIYRMESRTVLEFDKVSGEIRAMLERQYIQGEIQKVRAPLSLELDSKYFGELPATDVAHKHGLHFPPARTVHSHQH